MAGNIDLDKIDEATLALLFFNAQQGLAWKSFDWNVTSRLHERGFISDPARKTKSVVFTEEGLREAERLFNELFGKRPE